MNLSQELRSEYESLFDRCEVRPDRRPDVHAFVIRLYSRIDRYEEAQRATSVPWYVIGLLHGMECSFDFSLHLHNGDPLRQRTVNVPKGRPVKGDPPFQWLESAIDALQYDHLTTWTDWSVAGICYKLEAYNGWGYRQHHINSPYLWSFSNLYERGKFTSDGHWDENAVSKQVGAIVALKMMIQNHLVALRAGEVLEADLV
jgi:lysozyme family protein